MHGYGCFWRVVVSEMIMYIECFVVCNLYKAARVVCVALIHIIFVGFLFCLTDFNAYALDEIILSSGNSSQDVRYAYPHAVLMKALDVTSETDGPYTVSYSTVPMSRKRALKELARGKLLNVHVAATRPEWELKAIPVRIPVLKGLLGYRLLLTRCDNLLKFEQIRAVEELKQLKVGSGAQWTTTDILRTAGFNVVSGTAYEGLFGMLDTGRFDYIPRGVNEIFPELDSRRIQYPDLCIEPSLVLYFPTPSYFFVSPHLPKLADRIERGLEQMIEGGEMEMLFKEYYGDAIARAELDRRILLTIENGLLSQETPFDRSELWYRP